MSLYRELKRRNVIRVAVAYAAVAWLLIQIAETVFPLFGFDDLPARIVVILLAVGFVPALLISWAFEITPDGWKREADVDREEPTARDAGKKLDRITIAVLAVALAYFAVDKFVFDPQRDIAIAETAAKAAEERAREEARLDMVNDKSIAVLPFDNRSELKSDEYFTDGMHDELLTRLSRISSLTVISRTSSMKYRGTDKTIPEIARELSVATILEGGVQRAGNHVRINVQLIDASTDEHLWAEIYDRELTAENLFAIQSEITSAIADSLKATLSPAEKSRVYDLPTDNLEAYNHFLRGRQALAQRTLESLEEALRQFEQAVELDPEFALAWVGVADSVYLLSERAVFDRRDYEARQQAAIEKALAIDDELGEAYASLGMFYAGLGEDEKRVAAFEKAIELNPNYAQTYHWYANSMSGTEPDWAERRLQLLLKGAQVDPLSSIIQLNVATALHLVGRTDESLEVIDGLIGLAPNFDVAHTFLGEINSTEGRLASAVENYRRALDLNASSGARTRLVLIYSMWGNFDAVDELFADAATSLQEGSRPYIELVYWNHIARGRFHEALDFVDQWPEAIQDSRPANMSRMRAYWLLEDYDTARDYIVRANPALADPDRWQEEVNIVWLDECEVAGAMHSAGDLIGTDYLQLLIRNYEAGLAENKPAMGESHDMLVCYLAAGSFDKALDILDRETAEGRLIDQWWFVRQLPWLKPIREDARYLAVVERVEQHLEQQRALLTQRQAL